MDNSRGTAAWLLLACVGVVAAAAVYLGIHQSPTGPIPTRTVAAASANTLAASGYTELYVVSEPGQRVTYHVLYQKPDRLSFYFDSAGSRRYVVFDGSTQYLSQVVSTGSTHVVLHYCRVAVQPTQQDPAQTYLKLASVSPTPVKQLNGGVYSFTASGSQGTLVPAFYRVAGPYITQFGAQASSETWQLDVADINHAPPVTVPAHVSAVCPSSQS